jgi:hypothetical protein
MTSFKKIRLLCALKACRIISACTILKGARSECHLSSEGVSDLSREGLKPQASEVEAYLKKHPQELAERNTFGQVSGDRMRAG